MEGQAGQWPWGCRGCCVLALALWRGWLSWRWQDNGNPRRGGSSGRGTRPWKEVWELSPRRRPAGLCCLIEPFSLHIVLLSEPQIKRIPKSQTSASHPLSALPHRLCFPGAERWPHFRGTAVCKGGMPAAIPGFQPCGHCQPWAGPPRIRATLQVCSLHASWRHLAIRATRPVINSASRENAENTYHLRIHVPAESAYIKATKFGGQNELEQSLQSDFPVSP